MPLPVPQYENINKAMDLSLIGRISAMNQLSGYRERPVLALELVPVAGVVVFDEAVKRCVVVLGLLGRVAGKPGIEIALERIHVPAFEIAPHIGDGFVG